MDQDQRDPSRPFRRAQRFALELPVVFRRLGDAEWQTGTTENLSDSGAVIRTTSPCMPPSIVDFVIALPSTSTHSGGCLTGQAQVVRSFTLLSETHESVFAVCFNECRLARRESVQHAAAALS
jgi:hypothetical protein